MNLLLKKITCIFLFSIIINTVFAQHTAHSTYINSAVMDGRGEVVATVDNNDTVKYWSIKDGSLLFTTKRESPEWFSKRTRYKMKNNDFLESYDINKVDNNETWIFEIRNRNPRFTLGRPRFKKDEANDYIADKASGQVLFYRIQNKKVKFWMYSLNKAEEPAIPFASYKTDNQNIYPLWSPKSQWIMCVDSRRIWNVATGKESKFDDGFETRGSMFNCAYNVAEDKVSIRIKEGMAVIETATGKLLNIYRIPDELLPSKDYTIPEVQISGNPIVKPLSDGKSFLYYYEVWSNAADKNDIKYRRAWIVTEGKVVAELID